MMLLRFLLSLFAFIGALAAAGALVFSIVLMLRFAASDSGGAGVRDPVLDV